MTTGIYTIENLLDGKLYVGFATDWIKRRSYHKHQLVNKCHPNGHLQNAVNIYGIDNFEFEILEECEEQFLASQEHYWATMLDTHNRNRGYNILPTDPYGRVRMSKESVEKMRISNTGKEVSAETRLKLSIAGIGRIFPEDVKKKIAESHKGKVASQETREKQRLAKLGHVQSFEQIEKRMEKIRGIKKPEGFGDKIRERTSKKIMCTDITTGKIGIFDSGKIAAEELGITRRTLITQLQKGDIWRKKYKLEYYAKSESNIS